jgi:hypothetical protein
MADGGGSILKVGHPPSIICHPCHPCSVFSKQTPLELSVEADICYYMLRPIDNYFLRHEEPVKSCLQFLRAHILKQDDAITETWQYGMPFFCYKKKRFCYLWVHKKNGQPYLGIVDGKLVHHPDLIYEQRARMKIFLIDPAKNIPVKKINAILKETLELYR